MKFPTILILAASLIPPACLAEKSNSIANSRVPVLVPTNIQNAVPVINPGAYAPPPPTTVIVNIPDRLTRRKNSKI